MFACDAGGVSLSTDVMLPGLQGKLTCGSWPERQTWQKGRSRAPDRRWLGNRRQRVRAQR